MNDDIPPRADASAANPSSRGWLLSVSLMATALATPLGALAVLLARDEAPARAMPATQATQHASTQAPGPPPAEPAASEPASPEPWPEPRVPDEPPAQEPAPSF